MPEFTYCPACERLHVVDSALVDDIVSCACGVEFVPSKREAVISEPREEATDPGRDEQLPFERAINETATAEKAGANPAIPSIDLDSVDDISQDENPYAAPADLPIAADPAPVQQDRQDSTGQVRIDPGRVLVASYQLYIKEFFRMFMVTIGCTLPIWGLEFLAQQLLAGILAPSEIYVVVSVRIALGLTTLVLTIVETSLFLDIARRRPLSWPRSLGITVLRMIALSLIALVILCGVVIIGFGAPVVTVGVLLGAREEGLILGVLLAGTIAVLLGLMFCQTGWFILDKKRDVVSALNNSKQAMLENKGGVLLLWMGQGALMTPVFMSHIYRETHSVPASFVIATFIYFFVVSPLVAMISSVTYLMVTGQPVDSQAAADGSNLQPTDLNTQVTRRTLTVPRLLFGLIAATIGIGIFEPPWMPGIAMAFDQSTQALLGVMIVLSVRRAWSSIPLACAGFLIYNVMVQVSEMGLYFRLFASSESLSRPLSRLYFVSSKDALYFFALCALLLIVRVLMGLRLEKCNAKPCLLWRDKHSIQFMIYCLIAVTTLFCFVLLIHSELRIQLNQYLIFCADSLRISVTALYFIAAIFASRHRTRAVAAACIASLGTILITTYAFHVAVPIIGWLLYWAIQSGILVGALLVIQKNGYSLVSTKDNSAHH